MKRNPSESGQIVWSDPDSTSTAALNMADHVRVTDEADPFRCQGVIQSGSHAGQCFYKALVGSKFCALHGGNKGQEATRKQEVANYRLQQYQERVSEFANNPGVKSLREEIGITRMVLESLLNQCDNANKLLVFTDKISALVGQISRLVESAQKLEEKSNTLLDRKIVMIIGDAIVTILSEYIKDPDMLTEIGVKICACIESAASPADTARALA